MRRARLLIRSLVWILLASCGGDEPGASETEADDDPSQSDEAEAEEDSGEAPPAIGDRCDETRLILEAPTTQVASLRNASPDPQGIAADCGLTGPAVFIEASLRDRADLSVGVTGQGFTPRFAVLWPGCSADPSRVLACGDALPITLGDLGPDVDVLIAVGIDADDPALLLEAPAEQPDPLAFELRLETRPVLAELDRCGPAFGRCEAGTVCLPGDEDGVLVDRCRRPPADSCVAPGTVIVPSPGAAAMIEIPPSEPHSDAHEHSCAGWRRPERVERLELPTELDETATLVIVADDPRVGLALREPDCLPEHELACAPAGSELASLVTSGAALLLGAAPLLFIELPNPELDAGPVATIHVSIEVIE